VKFGENSYGHEKNFIMKIWSVSISFPQNKSEYHFPHSRMTVYNHNNAHCAQQRVIISQLNSQQQKKKREVGQ